MRRGGVQALDRQRDEKHDQVSIISRAKVPPRIKHGTQDPISPWCAIAAAGGRTTPCMGAEAREEGKQSTAGRRQEARGKKSTLRDDSRIPL
jgi:hypothetical protein